MSGFWLAVALAVIVLIGAKQRTAGTAVLSKALPYVILVAVLVALYAWFPFPLVLSETRRLLAANLGPNTWFVTDPLGVYVVLAPPALLGVWLVYRRVVGVKRTLAAPSPTAYAGTEAWQYHQDRMARQKKSGQVKAILTIPGVVGALALIAWLVQPDYMVAFILTVWRPVALFVLAAFLVGWAAHSKRYGTVGYFPFWTLLGIAVVALGASVYLTTAL